MYYLLFHVFSLKWSNAFFILLDICLIGFRIQFGTHSIKPNFIYSVDSVPFIWQWELRCYHTFRIDLASAGNEILCILFWYQFIRLNDFDSEDINTFLKILDEILIVKALINLKTLQLSRHSDNMQISFIFYINWTCVIFYFLHLFASSCSSIQTF